jgi:hypothetical protein
VTDPWAGAAIDLVERVSDALAARAVPCVLIGAAAMAVHGYPRATQDLDLGVVDVPLATLRDLANELRQTGLSVELREPDGDDPLGGLLRIDVDDELQIDVVNFGNPFTGRSRREGRLAIESPTVGLEGRRLRVAGLVPLIVLKLAAGSRFDLRDAAELIARHPEIDREALRAQCVALRLDRKLTRVLADVDDTVED